MADLAERGRLEADFARDFGRLSAKHRRELVALMGYPPDPSRVTDADWQRWEQEDREKLAALLAIAFLASAEAHAQMGGDDGSLVSQLTQLARSWAGNRSAQLARDMASNSRTMLDGTRRDWEARRARARQEARNRLSTPPDAPRSPTIDDAPPTGPDGPPAPGDAPPGPPRTPPPPSPEEIETAEEEAAADAVSQQEVQDEAVKIFGPNRTEGVATTETTGAISAGGDAGVDATVGTSADDLWITERDAKTCRICRPLHRTKRSVWGAYLPKGPPAHPRCRCFVEYAALVAVENK